MSDKRILIVDDEEAVLNMLQQAFNTFFPDYPVVTSPDPFTALEELEQQSFDLVLTDYQMSEMNGLELSETVRRLAPNTRIILMTGYGSESLRRDVAALGLDGYLAKPFSLAKVMDLVREVLANPPQAGDLLQDHAELLNYVTLEREPLK